MKARFLFLIGLCLLASLFVVQADWLANGVCERGTSCGVSVRVINDSTFLPFTSANCTLTVRFPNTTLWVDQQVMSNTTDGWYNYSVLPSVEGRFPSYAFCHAGFAENTTADVSFTSVMNYNLLLNQTTQHINLTLTGVNQSFSPLLTNTNQTVVTNNLILSALNQSSNVQVQTHPVFYYNSTFVAYILFKDNRGVLVDPDILNVNISEVNSSMLTLSRGKAQLMRVRQGLWQVNLSANVSNFNPNQYVIVADAIQNGLTYTGASVFRISHAAYDFSINVTTKEVSPAFPVEFVIRILNTGGAVDDVFVTYYGQGWSRTESIMVAPFTAVSLTRTISAPVDAGFYTIMGTLLYPSGSAIASDTYRVVSGTLGSGNVGAGEQPAFRGNGTVFGNGTVAGLLAVAKEKPRQGQLTILLLLFLVCCIVCGVLFRRHRVRQAHQIQNRQD